MTKTNLVAGKVSPWSTIHITATTGFTDFLVWLIAIDLLCPLLSGVGLLIPISEVVGGEDSISAGPVLGLVAAVGALRWMLSIGFITLGVIIYNACGDLVEDLKISLTDNSQTAQLPADPGVTPIRWRRDRIGSEVSSVVQLWSSRNGYLTATFN